MAMFNNKLLVYQRVPENILRRKMNHGKLEDCLGCSPSNVNYQYAIWRCPKIGVPLNHPFIDGFFMKQTIHFGYPHVWKPPYS